MNEIKIKIWKEGKLYHFSIKDGKKGLSGILRKKKEVYKAIGEYFLELNNKKYIALQKLDLKYENKLKKEIKK